MITLLKKIPFFLLLLVTFFCLHEAIANYGYLNLPEVINVDLIIILIKTTLFYICITFKNLINFK